MPANVPSIEQSLKLLDIVRLAMMAAIVFYGFVSVRVLHSHHPIPPTFYYMMMLMGAAVLALAFQVRKRLLTPANEALHLNSQDPVAHRRLRAGFLVTYTCFEAVALYGVVVRASGATPWQTMPFLVGGFLLLLIFPPRVANS